MIKFFPFIFILLWSSAFITTKPIIDNSDPFSALSFRFLIVALGFFDLISWKKMLSAWRMVVMTSAVAGAVITPSTDPITMLLLSTSITILFL